MEDINLEGQVTNVYGTNTLWISILDGGGEEHPIRLPILIQNEFEIPVYAEAYLGAKVRYHNALEEDPTSPGKKYEKTSLEFLDGRLEGRIYRHSTLRLIK